MTDTSDSIPATATKIEINLSRLPQLFNSLDPSPFLERDLDHDAEDYIVGSAEEAPRQHPLALVIHLPADQLPAQGLPNLREAIHNYFAYRRDQENRRLRLLFRDGYRAADRPGLLVLLHAVAGIGEFLRQRQRFGYFWREHVDHWLGGDVASLGDFSLRVGADAPPMPNTCEACRNASDYTVKAHRLTISSPFALADEIAID